MSSLHNQNNSFIDYFHNTLNETLDGSNILVEPILQDKETALLKYYSCAVYGDSNPTHYLMRFENKWHEGGGKIGKKAKSLTVHPMNPNMLGIGHIHKKFGKIKYPFGLIYGIIQGIKDQYYKDKIEGFILFLDPKFSRYEKLITRVVSKDSFLKSKFDFKINSLEGKNSGVMVSLVSKGKDEEQVFDKLFQKYSKLGIGYNNLKTLVTAEEFQDDTIKQLEKAITKSTGLKPDLNFKIHGTETNYNKALREKKLPAAKSNSTMNSNFKDVEAAYVDPNHLKTVDNKLAAMADGFASAFFDNMGLEAITTPISDPKLQEAVIEFTGNAYTNARKFMLGLLDERNANDVVKIQKGEETTKQLDKAFKKYGHNLTKYKGYIYRGVDFEKNLDLFKDMIQNQFLSFPTYTSFSFKASTAESFSNVPFWCIKAMKDPKYKFEEELKETIIEDTTVNGDELYKLLDKINTIPSYKISKTGVMMYSSSKFTNVNAIIPGENSKYESEAEIVVQRSTKIQADSVRLLIRETDVGSYQIYLIYGFIFPKQHGILGESDEPTFKGMLMNEKVKDKKEKKTPQKSKEKNIEYTKEQLEDLKLKFGSNPF